MVVEIMFTGLIAFVKGHCSIQDTDTMQIVMLDGMVTHKPRLIVDVRNVLPPGRTDILPDEIIELSRDAQVAVWSLEGKRIQVVDAKPIRIEEGGRHKKDQKDEFLNAYPKEHVLKPDPSNDLTWAPELNRACLLPENKPSDLYVKPDVLNDATLGDFGVARFATLTVDKANAPPKSVLETDLGSATTKNDVYEFDRQIYNYRQVLADHARLKLVIDDNRVTLKLHTIACDQDGLSKEERARLRCDFPDPTIRLAPARDKADLSISVSNLPSKKSWYPDAGAHFHEYYKLLAYDEYEKCPMPYNPNLKMHSAGDQGTTAPPDANDQDKIRTLGVQPIKCVICTACGTP